MGYLGRYTGTETIDLGDGYYVKVKKCLSGDEIAAAERAVLQWTPQLVGDGWRAVPARAEPSAYVREMAIASLAEWNIDDDTGNVLPLDTDDARRGNYGLLSRPHQEQIEEVVARLNAAPTREETVQFPAGGKSGRAPGKVDPPDGPKVLKGVGVVGAPRRAPGPAAGERETVERDQGVRADLRDSGDTEEPPRAETS